MASPAVQTHRKKRHPIVPKIQGYSHEEFDKPIVEKHPPCEIPTASHFPGLSIKGLPSLFTETDCRNAIMSYAMRTCCVGTDPAREMDITALYPKHVHYYDLITFGETRSTCLRFVPHREKRPLDGANEGVPPSPWEIPCSPTYMNTRHELRSPVPHTTRVQACDVCAARGSVPCSVCEGSGYRRCKSCGGLGVTLEEVVYGEEEEVAEVACESCGRKCILRCKSCYGSGQETCRTCKGHRAVRTFVELRVNYRCERDSFMDNPSPVPEDDIFICEGSEIFIQEDFPVAPITTYSVDAMNKASISLVTKHNDAYPGGKILKQVQSMWVIPVTEVHYTWREFSHRLWVYGNSRNVYAPDYPQQCCMGCKLM
ncbi:protein SSUH2 homolog [Haliotis cracherodii]|uniref:protein SSUH2 homolog n=1 Tax=Haliotis cracherodii TaxID=6455 RepID=UPI0039E8EAC4